MMKLKILWLVFIFITLCNAEETPLTEDEKIKGCLAFGRFYMDPLYDKLNSLAYEHSLNGTAYGKKLALAIVNKCKEGASDNDLRIFNEYKFTLGQINTSYFDPLKISEDYLDELITENDTLTQEEVQNITKINEISAELKKEITK